MRRRAQHKIQKKVEMPDKVQGRLVFMMDDIQHFPYHIFAHFNRMGMINRITWRKTGNLNGFLGAQAIEFQPDIFPWCFGRGDIGGNLVRENHKALPGGDAVILGFPMLVLRAERA